MKREKHTKSIPFSLTTYHYYWFPKKFYFSNNIMVDCSKKIGHVLRSWDLYISSYITWCGFYPHKEQNTKKLGWIMLCISSSRGNVTYSPIMLVSNIVTSFVVMEVVQRIRPLEVWLLSWHYTFWWKQSGVNQEENRRKKSPIWI